MLQGGSLAHCLLTEVLPQPPVDQTVQEALEGDGQGLREREGRGKRCLYLPLGHPVLQECCKPHRPLHAGEEPPGISPCERTGRVAQGHRRWFSSWCAQLRQGQHLGRAEERNTNHQTRGKSPGRARLPPATRGFCPGWHQVLGLAGLPQPCHCGTGTAQLSQLPPPSPLTHLMGTNVPVLEPRKRVFTYCSNVEEKDRGRFDAGEGEEGEEEGCRWKTKGHSLVFLSLIMLHLEFPSPSGKCPSPVTAYVPWHRALRRTSTRVQRGPPQHAAQGPWGTHCHKFLQG